MLSKEFEVLTPLSKVHRITRQISDRDAFAIEPGMWVKLDAEGRISNIAPGDTLTAAVELCISNAVSGDLAVYEGNDTKVGSATTLAEPGIRVKVGTGLIEGSPTVGSIVSIDITDDDDGDTNTLNDAGGFIVGSVSESCTVGVITAALGDNAVEIRLTEPKPVA